MKLMNVAKKFGAGLKSRTGKITAGFTTACVAAFSFAAAAGAAPATGNTSVDSMLTEMEGGFSTAEKSFIYLALAAIPVTLIVVLFFWLRGKFKQSVSGA